ncbi:MAG: hypothetical protein NZM31_08795 [Gemmatales bacterium]|nr:hypothetical protein [Gemmatales bacterium]MDW8387090.1 hypothetical protein [Gemmatales bacterium]
MPIQFRCAYCNQLLGIARRKAGTAVNCPTCGKQIVVPTPEEGPAEEPRQKATGSEALSPPQNLLEVEDFEELFKLPENPGQRGQQPVSLAFAEPGARVFTQPKEPAGSRPPPSTTPPVPGQTANQPRVTTALLATLIGVGLGLLVLGFMAGLVAGRFVWVK